MRLLVGAVALGVLAAMLSVFVAGPASAHAFLSSSNPTNGALLSRPPAMLRLDFSESVVLGATRVSLVDGAGRQYSPVRLSLRQGSDTEEPSQVTAVLPELPRGAYRVSWQTLSSDDLHRTSGLLVFGIGTRVQPAPFAEPTPRVEEAALRWLLFVGLSATFGGLLLIRLQRRVKVPAIELRARRLARVGAAAAALTAVGLLAEQIVGSDISLGSTLSSGYGARWGLREAGLLLLFVAAVKTGRDRVRTVVLLVGSAAACLGSALLGHSGSISAAPTRVLADAAHLAATATWTGLVLAGAVVLVLRRQVGPVLGGAVLRRYRTPAASCVAVAVVTGIYLSSTAVGSVDALLMTDYGRILVVKIGCVGIAGCCALANTVRLHRRRGRDLPRGTVLAESVAGLVALALAALLTSGQPAREPQFVRSSAPPVVPAVDGAAADLQEWLALRPNLPGRNIAVVNIYDTRRPAPAPIQEVRVAVLNSDGGKTAVRMTTSVGDGQWTAPLALATSGPTKVEVVVLRPGMPATVHRYAWTVAGGGSRRAPLLSDAPIGAALRTASAVLAVLAALGASAVAFSVRRRLRREAVAGAEQGRPEPVRTPELVDG